MLVAVTDGAAFLRREEVEKRAFCLRVDWATLLVTERTPRETCIAANLVEGGGGEVEKAKKQKEPGFNE